MSILHLSGYMIQIFLEKMAKPFSNRGDPDQMQHSVVSVLALHYLPTTSLVSPD